MLKVKITEWIEKTFGKPRHRDRFEMNTKISELNKNGAVVRIEEIGLVFQRMKAEANEKDVKKWKQELEELTGTSLRMFQVGSEDLFSIASEQDVKKGALAGSLVGGKAMMLNVQIFKETFLAKSILFPGRHNENRRH